MNMKLSNDLIKDIQLARLYRSVAVMLEIGTLYALVWGIYTALSVVASWI